LLFARPDGFEQHAEQEDCGEDRTDNIFDGHLDSLQFACR
jgi:hypothetical protein